MILTRYLYKKSQVEYSLFISLLNRDCNEALFWTYELYFSGTIRADVAMAKRHLVSELPTPSAHSHDHGHQFRDRLALARGGCLRRQAPALASQ